ncbi:MAG: SH3 domain-containing protein, partial [Spirochaetia bacterium]
GALSEVLDPEEIIHIDLTVEFAGGSGAAAAFPFEVVFEDFTGTGEPQFGVRNRSITVTARNPYINETRETYWFRYNGSHVQQIVRNVDRTVTPRGRIDYTHVGERDPSGELRFIRSYASQKMHSERRARIDKSVRRLNDGRFIWMPTHSRLTEVVPTRRYTELRSQPRHDADVRDWITHTRRIQPTEVRVSSNNEVWLKVDEPRGARGWIPEADVRWQ